MSGVGGVQHTPEDLQILGAESEALQALSEKAVEYAKDGLSRAERLELISKGFSLLPTLPEGDSTKLEQFITSLLQYPGEREGITWVDVSVFRNVPPSHNPYCEPGLVAILAPMISELTKIMIQIELSSSKLAQTMMKLALDLAESAYQSALAAGKARQQQLEAEAEMHQNAAIVSFVQAGMTALVALGSYIQTTRAGTAAEKTSGLGTEKGAQARHSAEATVSQRYSNLTQFITQVTSGSKEQADAILTGDKAKLAGQEAEAQAVAQFFEKLISTMQQALQTQQEEGRGAGQYLKELFELYKSVGQTATGLGGRA